MAEREHCEPTVLACPVSQVAVYGEAVKQRGVQGATAWDPPLAPTNPVTWGSDVPSLCLSFLRCKGG